MSFLTLEDETCSIDNVVVFPNTRNKYQYVLDEDVNLLFCGEVEKAGSFIIDKIHEI
jgi:DNA polymerase III alpha subunit